MDFNAKLCLYSESNDCRSGALPLHDLITIDAIPPGALTTAEIDATMAYAEAEKAEATRAAYASDWKDFAAWCAARGAPPANPARSGHQEVRLEHVALGLGAEQ